MYFKRLTLKIPFTTLKTKTRNIEKIVELHTKFFKMHFTVTPARSWSI